MLRAILALLFAILYLIIGIPVLFVEWIIGKFNRQAADISQLRMVQWAFRVILFICGTRLTIIGEENVPKDQPVLYIGNHRSYFDIIITYSRCPRLTGYVAKDSMKKVPLLSVWMSRLHCLFINRSDVKEALKTILAGIDNIKNGISMCIFPEGTRSKTGELGKAQPGALMMASKAKATIVPACIIGTDYKRHGRIWPKVTVRFGKPMPFPEDAVVNKEFLHAMTEELMQHIAKLQAGEDV